ncbi:unnamed protein product [Rotaria socialis]|uniref:Uncharacterized protein n=1 Tax=Rotaria socialis TaxID=392032 RepID=A0A817VFA6_9BILA|nr:unnamed protein product [Rotaria socialis]CAF4526548.1 unnamed protein product [Rotaria socialis]
MLEVENTLFSIGFRRLTITVNCTMNTELVNYVIRGLSIRIKTTHTATTTSSTSSISTTTTTQKSTSTETTPLYLIIATTTPLTTTTTSARQKTTITSTRSTTTKSTSKTTKSTIKSSRTRRTTLASTKISHSTNKPIFVPSTSFTTSTISTTPTAKPTPKSETSTTTTLFLTTIAIPVLATTPSIVIKSIDNITEKCHSFTSSFSILVTNSTYPISEANTSHEIMAGTRSISMEQMLVRLS